MQFQAYMTLLEQDAYARDHLVPAILQSFDKRYLLLVCKNFLRFAKGRGFKELSMVGQVTGVEDTHSPFFLQRLRLQLTSGDKLTKDFMNAFFNTLNEHTTENFVIFKELKNSYSGSILRRTKTLFQVIVDMYRMLEVMTAQAPELFVDKR
jgi:hypothetical protein